MRTVDPVLWSRKNQKRPMKVTTPPKFEQYQDVRSNFENRLRKRISNSMKEFWTNCSAAPVKYIRSSRSKFEMYRRVAVTVAAVSSAIFVMSLNCHQFVTTAPLLESLLSTQHSISDIDFPAVALCSTNIINKTALNEYVLLLESLGNRSYSREHIARNLLNFGALAGMAPPPAPLDVMFMQFLADREEHLNVTDILYRLSPQCRAVLARCSWAGRGAACADLFAARLTGQGYCCVFNSRYTPEDWRTPPKVLNVIGQDNGLSVVFKENCDEFAFVRSAIAGVQVLIFDGSEYPLVEAGSVRLYPLRLNTSVFISLRARVQEPTDSLRYYSEEWRGCRMRQLGARAGRSWHSSRAWCLALCRARTAAALCACRPHTLPALPPLPDAPPLRVCSPTHLACLNKYREKLVSLYPGPAAAGEPGLVEELENAQVCSHCAADCARCGYSARLHYCTHLPHLPHLPQYEHHRERKVFNNYFLKGLSLTNATVIQIFYPVEDQSLYAVEGYFRWYEVVSKISSQWVCVAGVAVLSVAELLFHLARGHHPRGHHPRGHHPRGHHPTPPQHTTTAAHTIT